MMSSGGAVVAAMAFEDFNSTTVDALDNKEHILIINCIYRAINYQFVKSKIHLITFMQKNKMVP